MQTLEIPIFKKIFDLYKLFHSLRNGVPKQDRFTIWQKCENLILNILEKLLIANNLSKDKKLPELENMSIDLNFLRVFLRLAKEIKSIDNAKYVSIEKIIDEIGRMLGGWIRSLKEASQNKNTLPLGESRID